MGRILHDAPREIDGMAHRGDAGDRAGREILAGHDRGIEIGAAIVGQHRAAACVEERVVLQEAHRGGHGIQAATARFEHGVAGVERGFEPLAIGCAAIRTQLLAGDHAGAAVDRDREATRCRRLLRRRGCGRGCHRQGHDRCQRHERGMTQGTQDSWMHGFIP